VPNIVFCGEPTVVGRPYCENHLRITYVPAPKEKTRKRKAIYIPNIQKIR
jgi:hypothetical protein